MAKDMAKDITLLAGLNELNVPMTPIPVRATLYGVVTDAVTGAKLSGVNVDLWNSSGVTLIATTLTDSNGYYRIENIVPGNYIVTFVKEGYETVTK